MKVKNNNYIGYRIQLYPSYEIEQIFKEYFGVCRYVYNLGIKMHEDYYLKNKNKKDNSIFHYIQWEFNL